MTTLHISPNSIEPIRKGLSELLNTKITFEEIHNEVMMLEFGMSPINKMLSEHIIQFVKQHFSKKP